MLFASVLAAPTLKVDAIIVEGNVRSGEQAILRVMRTTVNKPVVPTTLSEDIKRIYRLGFYADIQMELKLKDQKLTLVVRVEEKPSIRKIIYENNDALSEEELRK